jgi:hypothetical protein
VYAIGGSVAIVALADITLSNVTDRHSFVSIQASQNVIDFNFSSSKQKFDPMSPNERLSMNAVGGSLYISSRLSINATNVTIASCSATVLYNGSSASNMSALGGAAFLLSGRNPFILEKLSWFPAPSRFSLRDASFLDNRAACVRYVAYNSSSFAVVTAMGGALAILHSNQFASISNGSLFCCTDQNHGQAVSLSKVSWSNNSVSADFAFPSVKYEQVLPMEAYSVVLGGAL